jgi:hypothetical protein
MIFLFTLRPFDKLRVTGFVRLSLSKPQGDRLCQAEPVEALPSANSNIEKSSGSYDRSITVLGCYMGVG